MLQWFYNFLGPWYHYKIPICLLLFVIVLISKKKTLMGESLPISLPKQSIGIAVGTVWVLLGIVYVVSNNYIDHLEPTIAAITLSYMNGHPLYPDLGSGNLYGLLYGPLLFWINSLPLLFSKISTLTQFSTMILVPLSKLAGTCAFFAAMAIWLRILSKLTIDRNTRFLTVVFLIVV